MNDRKNV